MLKILIAEDNIMLGDLFEDYLTVVGYDVVGVARTIEEAVALAVLHEPDVAIVDYRLGNNELGTQIRSQIANRSNTAVLYLSGEPLGALLTKADGEGFIQKPVGLDDLDRALRLTWSLKTKGHDAGHPVPPGFRKLPDPPESALRVA